MSKRTVFHLLAIVALINSQYLTADDSNRAAQLVELGNIAYSDDSKTNNFFRSFGLFLEAAELGEPVAQYNVAVMYESGKGVSQDFVAAASWYRKAANQGDAISQKSLAVMYMTGRGITKDSSLAIEWFKKAAKQGNIEAISALDLLTGDGFSVGTWGETRKNMAITVSYKYNRMYQAQVGYNRGGKRRLYIEITTMKDVSEDICTFSNGEATTEVWTFDRQTIKMGVRCVEMQGSDITYLSAFPESEAGREYVIDLFKRSPSNVIVSIGDISIPFSAIGFTNAWNNNQEDAL